MDARLASSPCFSAASSAWASAADMPIRIRAAGRSAGIFSLCALAAASAGPERIRAIRSSRMCTDCWLRYRISSAEARAAEPVEHVVDVGAEAAAGFLEPDVAHDAVAGEQA